MSAFLRSLRRAMDRQRVVTSDSGLRLTLSPDAKLIATVEEDSRVPLWLLANAKAVATLHCRSEGATEWDGFVALTAVCTAAEALVNRLLESLVPASDWDGSGRKSIERLPLPDKWVKLSSLLGMVPPYSLGSEPLQSFKKVVDARNGLVHFKHGKNLRTFKTEVPYRLGSALPTVEEIAKNGPREVLQEGSVEPSLNPSLAPSYYEALERILMPVLAKCPGTRVADVADRIHEALRVCDATLEQAARGDSDSTETSPRTSSP